MRAKYLFQMKMRGLAIAVALMSAATSYAQIGEWIANQIREEIEGEISKITNYNSNNLGSFGSYIWESVVSAKCESDLKDKAKEFRNFEIDKRYSDLVPGRYPNRSTYWLAHSEIVPTLLNHANEYFHGEANIKFSEVADSKINKYALAYIDSIESSFKIENIGSVLNKAVLDSLKQFAFQSELTTTLLNDINEHNNLAVILNNHPEAVRVYAHSIGASALRTSPQHLLYWSVKADSHKDNIPPKQSIINPRSLYFTQNSSVVDILSGETLIARLRGNIMEVYDVNIMNLMGRPNTTYVFGNNQWQTDEHGRVINAKQEREKTLKKKCKQKVGIKQKSFSTVLEIPTTSEIGFYNSIEFGAPEVLLNVYVHDRSKDNKNAIKLAKKSQNKLLKQRQKEHLPFTSEITAVYHDNGNIPANIELDKFNSGIISATNILEKSRTIPERKGFVYQYDIKPKPKSVVFKTPGRTITIKPAVMKTDHQKSVEPKLSQHVTPNAPTKYEGEYTLKGKINGLYAVTLNLRINQGKVGGSYYYDKYKRTMKIEGEISHNGRMKLIEYENDDVTGKYVGYFDGTVFSGEFTHTGNTKSLPFYLTLQ